VSYLTPDERRVDTLTGDIGGGGVFIENNSPLHVGTEIAITLLLPDDFSMPLQAEGKVAWVRREPIHNVFESGMGVQFTDISETARNRLVRMITSLEKARYGK
ncbi:MAG: PilZ domain-containing protein, partial [Acidobacteria bacterium]|nr:PilZ domain-containing protein [Acidobacteriota bacterium]